MSRAAMLFLSGVVYVLLMIAATQGQESQAVLGVTIDWTEPPEGASFICHYEVFRSRTPIMDLMDRGVTLRATLPAEVTECFVRFHQGIGATCDALVTGVPGEVFDATFYYRIGILDCLGKRWPLGREVSFNPSDFPVKIGWVRDMELRSVVGPLP